MASSVRILGITVPTQRVRGDVVADALKRFLVADDVIVVVPLPDGMSGAETGVFGAFRYSRLEGADDCPERSRAYREVPRWFRGWLIAQLLFGRALLRAHPRHQLGGFESLQRLAALLRAVRGPFGRWKRRSVPSSATAIGGLSRGWQSAPIRPTPQTRLPLSQ